MCTMPWLLSLRCPGSRSSQLSSYPFTFYVLTTNYSPTLLYFSDALYRSTPGISPEPFGGWRASWPHPSSWSEDFFASLSFPGPHFPYFLTDPFLFWRAPFSSFLIWYTFEVNFLKNLVCLKIILILPHFCLLFRIDTEVHQETLASRM